MTQVRNGSPAVMPYFPRSGPKHASNLLRHELPSRPKTVGPAIDTVNAKRPLEAFDEKAHNQCFNSTPTESGEAIQPPCPADFAEKYLFPTLSPNERLRLTLLWYHTRSIEQDERLLAEIDALVRSAQKSIGWEFAVSGVLNESTYKTLAAANSPVTYVSRREITCAHTINQNLGSVFMITDMAKDWRFKHSPLVEAGGMRSYAGTPLRLMADNGVEIPLGTLCVASPTPKEPLDQAQRETLVNFAELISTAIANRTHQRRLKVRQEMTDLLSILSLNLEFGGCEENALVIMQQAYPNAHVSLQSVKNGCVPVEGREEPVALSEVHDGLWEDSALIEESIITSNFDELKPAETARAVIARCGNLDKYVVISGLDIHQVYDDFDAWFVGKAASIISDAIESKLPKEAIAAKEKFICDMAEQLQYPLAGVQGVTGLLAGDEGHLTVLRKSGQHLARTVAAMQKFDNWTQPSKHRRRQGVYDLNRLKKDILPKVVSQFQPEELRGVSVEFSDKLPSSHLMFTDSELMKETLREVLHNAVQSVAGKPSGTVKLTMRTPKDGSRVIFDIVDTGAGIPTTLQESIFQPFTKEDSKKAGAGLGLAIASRNAISLHGKVRLVSSTPAGSHFQVSFNDRLV
ncbi:hypothetical protein GGR57DRAFT_433379 [Xylariaceae sp. FL1272]|nr:hypothetical protein GGR57DRAFT_433379 [Xylariaceae sp. FL1272]